MAEQFSAWLPVELWGNVITYLPSKDVHNLLHVARQTKRVITEHTLPQAFKPTHLKLITLLHTYIYPFSKKIYLKEKIINSMMHIGTDIVVLRIQTRQRKKLVNY